MNGRHSVSESMPPLQLVPGKEGEGLKQQRIPAPNIGIKISSCFSFSKCYLFAYLLIYCLIGDSIKSKAWCILARCSTMELYPQLKLLLFMPISDDSRQQPLPQRPPGHHPYESSSKVHSTVVGKIV